jgi:hypothetical protein
MISGVAYAATYVGLSGASGWKSLEKTLTKRLDMYARAPDVAREIEYFKANIGKVKTAEDLTKDYRLYSFALRAHGLDSQINSQALMRKVLESDPDSTSSYAYKMTDPKFRDFARSFGFGSSASALNANTEKVEDALLTYIKKEFTRVKGETINESDSLQQRRIAAFAVEGDVAAEIAYVRKTIASLKSADDVVKDKRITAFLKTAFDLKGASDETLKTAITSPDIAAKFGKTGFKTVSSLFSHIRTGKDFAYENPDAPVQEVVDAFVRRQYGKAKGIPVPDVPTATIQKQMDEFAKSDPATVEAIRLFRTSIQMIDSKAEAMTEFRVYDFALKAYGLENYRNSRDLMGRVFNTSGDDRNSPAASDPRLKAMSKAFDFLTNTPKLPLQSSANVNKLVDRYVRESFEIDMGQTDPDMRMALYASRTLPGVTSGYQVLGNTALRSFVFRATGIPESTNSDVDVLSKKVEAKLEMGRLKDGAYVGRLVEKFLSTSSAATSQTASLFGSPYGSSYEYGAGGGLAMSASLLLAIRG